MLDFAGAVSEYESVRAGIDAATDATSTVLAHSYGLTGAWAALSGIGRFVAAIESQPESVRSRLGWTDVMSDGSSEVIAVGSRTIWGPPTDALAVVCAPNRMGFLDEVPDDRRVAVAVVPEEVGGLMLPPTTMAVALRLGRTSLTLLPGEDGEVAGAAAALAMSTVRDRSYRTWLRARAGDDLVRRVVQLKRVRAAQPSACGVVVIVTPAPTGGGRCGASRPRRCLRCLSGAPRICGSIGCDRPF